MPETILSRCEQNGLRLTEQRRVIAQVLEAADDHPDVEELHARAAAEAQKHQDLPHRQRACHHLDEHVLEREAEHARHHQGAAAQVLHFSAFFLGGGGRDAVEFQPVPNEPVAQPLGDAFLKRLDLVVDEFDHLA